VVAPEAVKVALLPAQIIGLFTLTVTLAETLTVPTAVLVQLLAFIPVTVYVVFPGGVTDAVLVVTLPALALHV
jgi:hypothetical protein